MKTLKNKMLLYLLVPLMAVPTFSFAQYFQGLFDYDSTYDWGWDISLQSGSNYFIMGNSKNPRIGHWALMNMTISADGSTILSKNIIQYDNADIYNGNPGELKNLSNGGYIAPLTIQWPDTLTGSLYSAAGLIKYNDFGDTVFLKTYTDTSVYFDIISACAVMHDGGYLGGGGRGLNTPSNYPGYLIRTDSLGDTLWTRTYQYDASQWVTIDNIIPLSDGRIVLGAQTTYYAFDGSNAYTHNAPWFMVLDSMGNILKDTVYSSGYAGGGSIYKDSMGGYIHLGQIDTFETIFPADYQNFPNYIAHLDTNFRMDWITRFPFSDFYGHRYSTKAIQLQDGNFLVEGFAGGGPGAAPLFNYRAWAAKLDGNGNILWNQYYISDTAYNNYFRDVIEMPGGNLVFTGSSMNDTLPAWHTNEDVWLVGTDSNGCILPGGCNPNTTDGVKPLTLPKEQAFRVYPNPTTGSFTILASGAGTFTLYTLLGQKLQQYIVAAGQTELQFPVNISAGMYIGTYKPDDGTNQSTAHLLYQPY